MYSITKMLNGTFWCEGRVQDGKETWSDATLEAAIKSMKTFAKVMNHTEIKKKNIQFWQQQPVTATKVVPWKI